MCLVQGPQHSDAGKARTATPRSRVKHSTTEPLRFLICLGGWLKSYGYIFCLCLLLLFVRCGVYGQYAYITIKMELSGNERSE